MKRTRSCDAFRGPEDAPPARFVGFLKKNRRSLYLVRSEEHTSELQSPMYLVCRLLLEKKKIVNAITLSGCSAYGLAAASGVMQCLEGQVVVFRVGGGNGVAIVSTGIFFDSGRCDYHFK